MTEIQSEKMITGSTEMSFIDLLWGIEVTGGKDQGKPLTILAMKRDGLAKRAGMRIFDKILKINDIDAGTLTLQEAQLLINESGRYVRIAVFGEDNEDSSDESPSVPTVDFWFKPLTQQERAKIDQEQREKLEKQEEQKNQENQPEKQEEQQNCIKQKRNVQPSRWSGCSFPWNDKPKPIHRSSNCSRVVETKTRA